MSLLRSGVSQGQFYGAGWRNWNGKSDDELYEDYLKKLKISSIFPFITIFTYSKQW